MTWSLSWLKPSEAAGAAPCPGSPAKACRLVSFALFASLILAQGPTTPRTPRDDVATILELSDRYGEVFSNADVDGYLSLLTDDAIILPANRQILVGKEAIRRVYPDRFARQARTGTLDEITTPVEIFISAEWALDRGVTSIVWTPKDTGVATRFLNKYIRIWKRQPDGRWKLARVIWNGTDREHHSEIGASSGRPAVVRFEATNQPRDKEAVERLVQQYVDALENGDAGAYARLYSPEGIYLPDRVPPLVGRAAIRERLARSFSRGRERLSTKVLEVVVAGDWAFVPATFSRTFTTNRGSESSFSSGKMLWILVRQEGGEWRIHRYIWNLDEPAKSSE